MEKSHNSVEESQQNDFDDVSSLFEDTEQNIGGKYDETVTSVIEISKDHLNKQNDTKNKLRTPFTWFFCVFLSIEYIGLIVLIILNACIKNFTVSEYVLVTYISSVFLETLGVILFMIKFAYNNKTELKILEILQSIVNNYKK
mgnify:CR=1 FL=1